ncbi:Putative amidoligase enzyme [Desulfotomaculum arcticum]|uniref:Putative amidoligase enzyme n=1 Tax=Desulfotruncus arcticus DSM 17038 TaxID=1121424 RepID=A0A1I2YC55_9FIRM|nr:amidoligase family protein [Desulfotruncus arcticus]SFH23270.1 Putative amidoligase enzyme [Desulfotomaculum arcticum] [Desulfotruncus arcticus DSM 17038]
MPMREQEYRVTFNESRTFGVEIEFFGITAPKALAALNEAGINVHHETYNHTTRRHWKLIYDVSVNNKGTGLTRGGHELVSPILKGREGLKELKAVMNALGKAGAKVDRTCGLHVHHDVTDYQVENFVNLYAIYYKFENYMDAILPPSRRGNGNRYCRGFNAEELKALLAAKTLNDINRVMFNRYKKLNFQAYYRHNTIEFRQHGGTHEAEKAVNWVVFTQALVERAKGGKMRIAKGDWDRDAHTSIDHERRLRRILFGDVTRDSLKTEYGQAFKYQMKRREHFASVAA